MIKTITVANIVEFTWLSRRPQPTEITVDQGKKILGMDFRRNYARKIMASR